MLTHMKLVACRLVITALMALTLGGCFGSSRYGYGRRPGYPPMGSYGYTHHGGWYHAGGRHR